MAIGGSSFRPHAAKRLDHTIHGTLGKGFVARQDYALVRTGNQSGQKSSRSPGIATVNNGVAWNLDSQRRRQNKTALILVDADAQSASDVQRRPAVGVIRIVSYVQRTASKNRQYRRPMGNRLVSGNTDSTVYLSD
jgi:hypothetical protein